ncbi:MAG TPA: PAC2 family protein [Tepidisphaeraceae bacterium]|jgi:proteasome assembly chaperone (PAC2) family protein|nr:PAC2 family protein [Tepidisphaeraceae bacterium]
MPSPHLKFDSQPKLKDATLLLALAGWMDGGLVSTGTVRSLMNGRNLSQFASIESDPFYIYNFPGSMEIAAVFRPHVKYEEGFITDLQVPENIFHCDAENNLVFFIGQEPNLKWQAFADAIFELGATVGVTRIMFIGSFGGTVPHTRDSRLFGSVSHPHLRDRLKTHHVRLSDYEGPSGFSTLLLAQSPKHNIEMMSIVAEIPGYLQGLNPLSIEAVTRRLSALLDLPVDFDRLRSASNEWEAEVSEAVEDDKKLASTVRKLEERYDNELIGVVPSDDEDEGEEQGEEVEGEEDEE